MNVENSAPGGAVFLSYASQDAEAVRKICDALRAAGVEVVELDPVPGLRGLDGHVRDDPAETVNRVIAFARNRAVNWRRDDVTVVALTVR